MKKIKENKILSLSHSFLIRFLPFDNSAYPQNKFISNVVKHKHFVFSFTSFPLIVNFKFWIVPNSGQGTHMQMFLHRFIGNMVHPGPFLDARPGSVLKWNDTAITGQLFGIYITSKKISEDYEI